VGKGWEAAGCGNEQEANTVIVMKSVSRVEGRAKGRILKP
jgi:hypothetical protein